MWRRLFLEHPTSLGESYGAHFRAASSFGLSMLGAGIACLVHAILPAVFPTTGSRTVRRLHERMSTRVGPLRKRSATS